jgi:hypothetical protein
MEMFWMLPHRTELLRSLLSADLVGYVIDRILITVLMFLVEIGCVEKAHVFISTPYTHSQFLIILFLIHAC